jgi:UDP-N-acetylglucosamine--N-acetylmuramyl-(pentapeptide) pyrophosphoryl-undecaprenol N-acetylglucosamine transferase
VPIRGGFEPARYSLRPGQLRVLVLGGSQGAKSLNEAVPQALAELGQGVSVVHQCGHAHEAEARALYETLGFGERAQVKPFIIDMPGALAAADLVVGRAGASAVSEVCAVGRPSLLVPYPFAGDHQKVNADSLAREGAALWVPSAEATPERLASELRALMSDPAKLASMADSARRIGRPYAAQTIAEDLIQLAGVSSQLTTDNSQLTTDADNGFVKMTEVA